MSHGLQPPLDQPTALHLNIILWPGMVTAYWINAIHLVIQLYSISVLLIIQFQILKVHRIHGFLQMM